MAKAVINIGNASVDMEVFEAYQKKALQCLHDANHMTTQAKEFIANFKEHVESVAKTTKLSKKEVAAFWKARFEESLPAKDEDVKATQVIIARGELFDALNAGLEG